MFYNYFTDGISWKSSLSGKTKPKILREIKWTNVKFIQGFVFIPGQLNVNYNEEPNHFENVHKFNYFSSLFKSGLYFTLLHYSSWVKNSLRIEFLFGLMVIYCIFNQGPIISGYYVCYIFLIWRIVEQKLVISFVLLSTLCHIKVLSKLAFSFSDLPFNRIVVSGAMD